MNCFIPERQLCQVKYSWCLAKLIQSFRLKNKIKEFFFNSLVSLSYTLLACKIYSEKSTDSLMETALCMNLFFSWVFFSMINFLVFHFRQFYYNVFEGDYFELKFWSDLLASRTWNTNISPALGRQIPSPKQPVQRFWVGSLVVSTGRFAAGILGWAGLVPESAHGESARGHPGVWVHVHWPSTGVYSDGYGTESTWANLDHESREQISNPGPLEWAWHLGSLYFSSPKGRGYLSGVELPGLGD